MGLYGCVWHFDGLDYATLHCKKRLPIFPPPAGMSLTKLSLAGNNLNFPGQESLVSDIPSGDGKIYKKNFTV